MASESGHSNALTSPPPPHQFRGKFGKVFRCVEKNTGLTLAAKFIKLRKDADLAKVEKEVSTHFTILIVLNYQMCIKIHLSISTFRCKS